MRVYSRTYRLFGGTDTRALPRLAGRALEELEEIGLGLMFLPHSEVGVIYRSGFSQCLYRAWKSSCWFENSAVEHEARAVTYSQQHKIRGHKPSI